MFLLLMATGGVVWAAPEKSADVSVLQQAATITAQGTIVDATGEQWRQAQRSKSLISVIRTNS